MLGKVSYWNDNPPSKMSWWPSVTSSLSSIPGCAVPMTVLESQQLRIGNPVGPAQLLKADFDLCPQAVTQRVDGGRTGPRGRAWRWRKGVLSDLLVWFWQAGQRTWSRKGPSAPGGRLGLVQGGRWSTRPSPSPREPRLAEGAPVLRFEWTAGRRSSLHRLYGTRSGQTWPASPGFWRRAGHDTCSGCWPFLQELSWLWHRGSLPKGDKSSQWSQLLGWGVILIFLSVVWRRLQTFRSTHFFSQTWMGTIWLQNRLQTLQLKAAWMNTSLFKCICFICVYSGNIVSLPPRQMIRLS